MNVVTLHMTAGHLHDILAMVDNPDQTPVVINWLDGGPASLWTAKPDPTIPGDYIADELIWEQSQ